MSLLSGHNSAHSGNRLGWSSRGARLTTKLGGQRLTLRRLDYLLTRSVTDVTITSMTNKEAHA